MSSPTSELSKLSLGQMPVTRSQASAHAEEQEESEDDYASESSSGLEYNTAQLTPRSKKRFDDSRDGHFEVAGCGERDEENGTGKYYVFEIAETNKYPVRIGRPGKAYGNLPCHCGSADSEGGGACRHVFWLTDQIARIALSEAQKQQSLDISKSGYALNMPAPYRQISTLGIEKLARLANWKITATDEEEDEALAKKMRERRSDDIREILAALSPNKTTDHYRPDIFNSLSDENYLKEVLVKGDLEATLAKLLMKKDDVYHQFKGLVPENYRIEDTFQKNLQRKFQHRWNDAQAVFTAMNTYFAAGIAGDQTAQYDVAWGASELVKIVESIRNLLNTANVGRIAKQEAAKTLVFILGEVVKRDRNSYSGPGWANSQQRLQHDRETNLHHRLINSAGSTFVLSDLELIDAEAAQFSITDLDQIYENLNVAPADYKHRFRTLIQRWKNFSAPSGQKRAGPGESSGSSSKRRMK